MKNIRLKEIFIILMTVGFMCSLLLTPAAAQEKNKVKGKYYGVFTTMERHDIVGGDEGHKLSIYTHKGVDVINGGTYISEGTSDLINFNGSHAGYQNNIYKDGSYLASWQGKVKMTPAEKGGPPKISFEGTWSIIKGTGKYENAEGKGTYKGMFIAADMIMMETEGEIITKK